MITISKIISLVLACEYFPISHGEKYIYVSDRDTIVQTVKFDSQQNTFTMTGYAPMSKDFLKLNILIKDGFLIWKNEDLGESQIIFSIIPKVGERFFNQLNKTEVVSKISLNGYDDVICVASWLSNREKSNYLFFAKGIGLIMMKYYISEKNYLEYKLLTM
jgi:hypothetical protein